MITRMLDIHSIPSTEPGQMPSLGKMRNVGPSPVDKHPIGKNVEKMHFSEEIVFHFFRKINDQNLLRPLRPKKSEGQSSQCLINLSVGELPISEEQEHSINYSL